MTLNRVNQPVDAISHWDVVVSGFGPAALASAYLAAMEGKSVLIISDRTDESFVRVQRTILDSDTKVFILDIAKKHEYHLTSDDYKFIQELLSSTHVAIKDIERFLSRRLKFLESSSGYSSKMSIQYEASISQIDLEKGLVTISPKDQDRQPYTCEFQELVGADGSKHHAANQLLPINNQAAITYKWIPRPQLYHHISCYITLSNNTNSNDLLSKLSAKQQEVIIHDNQVCFIGIDMASYNPKKNVVKGIVNMEISEDQFRRIQKITDSKLKQATILDIITSMLARNDEYKDLKVALVKESFKHGARKDKLKIQTFITDLVQANQAAIVSNNHYFILVGDAFRSPNYQLGHGINDALLHVQWLNAVRHGTMSIQQYNDKCQALAQIATISTTAIYSTLKDIFIEKSQLKLNELKNDLIWLNKEYGHLNKNRLNKHELNQQNQTPEEILKNVRFNLANLRGAVNTKRRVLEKNMDLLEDADKRNIDELMILSDKIYETILDIMHYESKNQYKEREVNDYENVLENFTNQAAPYLAIPPFDELTQDSTNSNQPSGQNQPEISQPIEEQATTTEKNSHYNTVNPMWKPKNDKTNQNQTTTQFKVDVKKP